MIPPRAPASRDERRGRVTRVPPPDHAPKLITLYVPFPPSRLPARRMVSLPTTAWRRRRRGFHLGTPLSRATIAQGVLYAIAASYVARGKNTGSNGAAASSRRRRRRRLFCHRRGTPNAVAATKESIYAYVVTRKNDDRYVRQICLSHRYRAAGLRTRAVNWARRTSRRGPRSR